MITAFATLIGATSPIIVALIQSNKEKPQIGTKIYLPDNVVLPSQKPKIRWFVVLFFSLLGGFVGYGMAKLYSAPPTSPTVETTAIPITPKTPTPIFTSSPSILFNEDFEDGKAQNMTYIADGWKVIADETGNKVYDIDNSTGSNFPAINFGSANWRDYEIKLRTRFLENKDTWSIIYFRNSKDYSAYVVSLDLRYTSLNYNPKGNGWVKITQREYNLKKNIWYWVRIEAKGSEINIFIDDVLIVSANDTRFNSGYINIQAGQYAHSQFDDIQVKSLSK
jgi:hypothetical protein